MRDKVAAAAGATIGWGGAATLIFTGETMTAVLAQAFLLSVGAVSTGWSMLSCRNRPMAQAFELGCETGRAQGYEEGRADALAESGGGRVIRLRQGLEGRRRAL